MKLQDRSQIEQLTKFRGRSPLVTSFFFNTDKSRRIKKEIAVSLKNLLTQSREKVEAMALDREAKDAVLRDLDKIGAFGAEQIMAARQPGLAIFSASRENFWQDLSLPEAPRDSVVFEKNFFVKPLSAVLDEHRLIGVLLIDRREAQLYEISMDEGRLVDKLVSDVPPRVRPKGLLGYQEKKIERHFNAHIHEHFKKAAQVTFDLFKKRPVDWLLVGTGEEHRTGLEELLHPYLKDRLKGWLKARPSSPASQVIKEAIEAGHALKKKEEEQIVDRLVAELEKDGRAVSGLHATLESLNAYRVMTLVVTRDFSAPGYACLGCGRVDLEVAPCLSCKVKLEPVADVVDEAVEAALSKGIPVKHITPPSKLDRFGRIGAFLTYKTAP